jgi:hypothetical protein
MICATTKIKADAPGGHIVINESEFDPAKHERYIAPPPLPALPVMPPPPLAPPGPLANLPRDWRDRKTAWLRELAEKVAGRTPENREQSIDMIAAALAKAK